MRSKIPFFWLIFLWFDGGMGENYIVCDKAVKTMCHIDIGPIKGSENYEGTLMHFGRSAKYAISNELVNEILLDYENLTLLDFNEQKLADFNNETFASGFNLVDLVMNRCSVTHLEDFWFQNLRNLNFLSLDGNSMVHISPHAFYGLDKLEDLLLQNNKIENLHSATFQHTKNLQNLYLGQNRIKILDERLFEPLICLGYLHLDSNQIETVSYDWFKFNENLTKIDLGDNRIKYLNKNILKVFERLKFLDLTNNVCVDQLFEYKLEPNDPERILDVVLFPFCDADFKVIDSEGDMSAMKILFGIPLLFFASILVCVFSVAFVRNRRKIDVGLDVEAGKNGKMTEKEISDLILEYTDQSTVHGVKYLGERKRHWMEK